MHHSYKAAALASDAFPFVPVNMQSSVQLAFDELRVLLLLLLVASGTVRTRAQEVRRDENVSALDRLRNVCAHALECAALP